MMSFMHSTTHGRKHADNTKTEVEDETEKRMCSKRAAVCGMEV